MTESGTKRWNAFLWPALAVSILLLVLPQAAFVAMSFHRDIGMGMVGKELTLANYVDVFTDPFYLGSIWLTVWISVAATGAGLVLGFPTAYVLARMGKGWASTLLSLVIVTSLVTIVVKVMGLNILLGSSGLVNSCLLYLGLISSPLALLNNETGVVIGLVQYTLPILILLLFSGIQTIPVHLEDAAAIHGASRFSIMRKVVLPLAMPSVVAAALIAFNMNMGAFTSAVLLGGGQVRTLPVLIENKLIENTDYAMGATLSTILLLFVFVLNVMIGLGLLNRRRRA